MQRLSADAARQLHELHVMTGGAHDLYGVPFHAGRLVEEGNYVHVVADEHQLQQTAHAQPVQTIDAATQTWYGQLADAVLTLAGEGKRIGLAIMMESATRWTHHVLAHGQQGVVERRVGALLVGTLLGHQIVYVATALLQHGHVARVPLLPLQIVHVPELAAKLQIEARAHGKVGAHGMDQCKVFRCAKQIALGLGNLALGRSQLRMESRD